jgi:hypothetical protein
LPRDAHGQAQTKLAMRSLSPRKDFKMNQINEVAQTIIDQIGGQRMFRMIGVKKVGIGLNSVTLHFVAKALQGINKINVTLDPSDTYSVRFFRSTVKGDDLKYEIDDIYNDQLIELIESKTGLALRMPKIYNTNGERIA